MRMIVMLGLVPLLFIPMAVGGPNQEWGWPRARIVKPLIPPVPPVPPTASLPSGQPIPPVPQVPPIPPIQPRPPVPPRL